MPFSLSFSGGGCRGAAHIGVIKALCDAQLFPCAVSGTSAGAIAAGLYACGRSPDELIKICKRLERDGDRLIDFDLCGVIKAVGSLALHRGVTLSGLLKGERLRRWLGRVTGDMALNDIKLPLAIAGVDLSTGETVAFSQRKPLHALPNVRWQSDAALGAAIYASCCVPVIFSPPKSLSPALMVDGGVADNLPVDLLLALDAPNIVAVDISAGIMPPENSGIFEIASHSLAVMSSRLGECSVRGERLLIRPKLPENAGLFSFSQMSECIEAGYRAADELTGLIREISK